MLFALEKRVLLTTGISPCENMEGMALEDIGPNKMKRSFVLRHISKANLFEGLLNGWEILASRTLIIESTTSRILPTCGIGASDSFALLWYKIKEPCVVDNLRHQRYIVEMNDFGFSLSHVVICCGDCRRKEANSRINREDCSRYKPCTATPIDPFATASLKEFNVWSKNQCCVPLKRRTFNHRR